MVFTTDSDIQTDDNLPLEQPQGEADETEVKESDAALVKKIIAEIKSDKRHFEKVFKRMTRDMHLATHGRETSWDEKKYTTNIIGQHVKQKTATLYAKNPRMKAVRRETLDFQIWDESEQSLKIAMQTIEMAMQMQQQAAMQPPAIDNATGELVPPELELPPGFEQAQALIADFQQGMARRTQMKKFGKTLELLFSQAMKDQKPLDFKALMKQVVRRACTTGVGYVELGFQRETGPRPGMAEKLADHRARIDHLRKLMEDAAEGEIEAGDAEIAELEKSMASLQAEPEIVLREGLIVDQPQSTKVIPDRLTKSLVGFVGARHLTIEYIYTKQEAEELFQVDLKRGCTPYVVNGKKEAADDGSTETQSDVTSDGRPLKDELVCVWKYYDKLSGLVYFVMDGYPGFLREPDAPDVFVSDFWPVYALTFNAVESEDELFPPSDATLLLDQQREYNRSRQGKREHRQAARPRWTYANGAFDEEDVKQLQSAEPFDTIGLNIDPQSDINKMLQSVPVPGVDPNLYDVNEIWADFQIVAGGKAGTIGGMAKATATANAIAADGANTADGSSVDDLDTFLSMIARAGSQILMREMSFEQVMELVGPGAVWPEQSAAEIADEIYLDIEAGSSGKPNQAVEINNWREMLPFLIQLGSIPSEWLARESLRRLDDKMDLTEAIQAGLPAIVAQNRAAQAGATDDPNAQGAEGGDNAPKGQQGNSGSSAPMGDNNPTPPVVRYGTNGKRVAG